MPAAVPERAVTLSAASIVSGLPVVGSSWEAMASQYNHTAGMPSALIPLYAPDITIAAGATGIGRYRIFPRYQGSHRMWFVSAGTASGYADLTITFDSGSTMTFRCSGDAGANQFFEPLTGGDRTDVEHGIDLSIANDAASTGSAVVRLIGCYEAPRGELELYPSDDAGVSAETLRSGLPIYDGSADGRSLGGLTTLVDTALATARRTGLFAASPYFTTTSGAFVAAGYARGFVVRGRKKYVADTTSKMQVRAYCVTPVGTTGEIKFAMTSGANVTIAIPSNTSGWLTGEVDIDCDDFSDAYGRRSTRFDKCTVTARRTGGAGTVAVDHYGGGEA
jgi:hypothetical protein